MRFYDAPRPPRSCLDMARSPTTLVEIDTMRRRAWHEQGVASISIDDVTDPWLRQAITNEAIRRWGRRDGGHAHGR
jgi:hypothetical protein